MLEAIERSWTRSRWAVIKDARRRQRRRHRRFLAVAAVLLLAATVGWAIARNAVPSNAPAPASVTVGTVEPLVLGGVVQGTTTLEGRLWVLTCLSHCSDPFSTASAGQLVDARRPQSASKL
jgi:hypothetical protein